MANVTQFRVGIIGGRGYVGAELISIIAEHPHLELAYAASRSQMGEPVPGAEGACYVSADPDEVARLKADAVVLAVPDGACAPYCDALSDRLLLDLSSDHRFDDSGEWVYGLSELNTDAIAKAGKISNPGCYATALQLAAHPLLALTEAPMHAFGISGYSGAGTTPSDRNNPGLLGDGVTPYKLVGHTHEREASRHLNTPVRFTPCVAPYFRGIVLTLQATTLNPISQADLTQRYEHAYECSALISVTGEDTPRVQEIVGCHGARIGGISVGGPDKRSVAVVCVLDNLLKGAASQAIQNLNLALGLDIHTGLVTQEICV